jgi:cyclic pyranopterin phosphate synthase
VDRLRLTGGEPLLRRNLPSLIDRLSSPGQLRDLALPTNGILLAGQARALRRAGLHRVTVSLDTLRPDRFLALTRSNALAQVLAGITAAREHFGGLKIDTVVVRGTNDDELVDLVEYGRAVSAEVRFVEYMDVGGATQWTPAQVVSRGEMLAALERHYGPIDALPRDSSAPADRYRLPDGTVFGIVASTTAPFCGTCDRARLTSDGMWLTCLYATEGLDLRRPLRQGGDDGQLRQLIRERWPLRADRGAEERLAVHERRAFVPASELRRNAHLEMHTRGG